MAPSRTKVVAAVDRCRTTPSRTGSASSALTVKDSVCQKANVKPGQCTYWTDEKHNLYLDYLEASFVNQLHSSIGMFGGTFQENIWHFNSSQYLPGTTGLTPDQRNNFGKNLLPLDTMTDSCVVLENPCIHSSGSSTSSEQLLCRQCHQSLVCAEEFSDQNFVDEDKGENTTILATAKRLKS